MAGKLDGKLLREMILGAAAILEQNKDALDAMNVFPVPDGDTGTNMSLTMITAAKEVAAVGGQEPDVADVMNALSLGALKGARGNSGVILSQIFAGFVSAITEAQGDIDAQIMGDALARGVEYAYKAVMKPKEGTILTVAKSVAQAAETFAKRNDDVRKQMEYCIKEGEETLKQTPEMLPVLKEAGVVDAGGAGYLVLLMGFKAVLDGEKVDSAGMLSGEAIADFTDMKVNEDIEFGYCTEFFIKNLRPDATGRDIDAFRRRLSEIGDCVLVVGDVSLVKTHVHTNEPGKALGYALELGELSQIKIDNMREQHREIIGHEAADEAGQKAVAVVEVVSGEGIRDILADWQVDGFVEGGQSMNPSTHDILKVIESCNAKSVIVLPNNKNIILAAEQAADLSPGEVLVVSSKSIPQGIAAAVAYDPEADAAQNVARMEKAIAGVKTGQLTNAVRETKINGTLIKEGDVVGIAEGSIVSSGEDMREVALGLMKRLTNEDSEIIAIYYGEGVTEEQANELLEAVAGEYPACDTELMYGGQPVYQYLISVE